MLNNQLANKVALITGAGRRIGAEIARMLHENGMNIVLHYHQSGTDADKLALEFNKRRPRSAVIHGADLLEPAAYDSLINQACTTWNRLDVLVNNASRFYRTEIGSVTEAAWDDLMNSNARAPFFLSQAAAPHLKRVNGCIVNITDIHAERPMNHYSVYCITKSALLMMTKALARELGPEIRVNAVAPGAIIWPEGQNALSSAEKEKIIAHTALRRVGDPKDIASAVLFLVRDAQYVTGQVINVDAGRSL